MKGFPKGKVGSGFRDSGLGLKGLMNLTDTSDPARAPMPPTVKIHHSYRKYVNVNQDHRPHSLDIGLPRPDPHDDTVDDVFSCITQNKEYTKIPIV